MILLLYFLLMHIIIITDNYDDWFKNEESTVRQEKVIKLNL